MPYNLRSRLVLTAVRPSPRRNLVAQTVDHNQEVLDNRSGGNQRATKRKSGESHERVIKTSRTSQCLSEGSRPSFGSPLSRGTFHSAEGAGTSTPACIPETIPEATPETSFRSGSDIFISTNSEEKKGRKRKSEDAGEYGKRIRTSLSSGADTSYQSTTETIPEIIPETIPETIPEIIPETIPETTSSDEFDTFFSGNSKGTFYSTGDTRKSAPASTNSEEKKGRKRRSEETKASGERTGTLLCPGEGTSHQATLEDIPEDTFFSEDSGEIFYTAEENLSRTPASTDSEEKKSRKRKTEDTGDYGKRRRTSTNPDAGTSYPWYQAPLRYLPNPFPFLFNLFFPSIPEIIPETIPEAIPEAIPETSFSTNSEEKKGRKRKSEDAGEYGKRRRTSLSSGADTSYQGTAETIPETIPEATAETFFTDDNGECVYTAEVAVSRIPASTDSEEKKGRKRKCQDTGEYGKRRRTPLSSGEGCSYQATTEPTHRPTSSDSDSTFPETHLFHNRADFEAKYEEEEMLGEGGFGSVFAGHRKADHLPVAIKRVRQFRCITVDLHGEVTKIPTEVALLLHLKPEAVGTSVVVSMLDWYNLGSELILVLERPVPCMDLYDYLVSIQLSIQEEVGRMITKQLVEGLQELHSRGVFHRDIKMENILLETATDVPRVRIIDFGCGAFLTGERYTKNRGTPIYTTPEFIRRGWSTPEATTVWQLGVVLFEMLHDGGTPFHTPREISQSDPDIRDTLSYNCQDFLALCMEKSPETRPTLETLKHHPWLV